MTRAVRQMGMGPDRRENAAPRPFSEFSGQPNIVLLGDPGAGKTHLFRATAAAEQARLLTARAFLNIPAGALRGSALYLDGLDEKRAGRGDRDTIDALVSKLFDVVPPKVRISCRGADWLGASDLAALSPYFDQQGGAVVLHLESLSQDEQVAVLAEQNIAWDEALRFLAEAVERGLGDFLENPQNLIMLWRAIQTGAWPTARKQLFELSTGLMLRETNAERARGGGGTLLAAELRPVAGAICAARLISDVEAISLTDEEGSVAIPGYRSMNLYPPEPVQAALGRRVFNTAAEAEAVDYAHRTTAEFGCRCAICQSFHCFRPYSALLVAQLRPNVSLDYRVAVLERDLAALFDEVGKLSGDTNRKIGELSKRDHFGTQRTPRSR
jgi:hypothetical protein